MANIKCIDVSTWQGVIDWKKVKSAGYSHAILRAGFGRDASQVDNQFEKNYKNAKANGVKIGVYWYSYAVDKADAIKEANACLTVLKDKKLQMPVFFDMEEGSMTKLSKSTLTGMAKAFCDTIKKAGFEAGVYSNLNWFTNYLDFAQLKKSYYIWLAQWSSKSQLSCDVWQYSSKGKVNGIEGEVDMNIIYNEKIIKSETQTAPAEKANYEIAGVQALLWVLHKLKAINTSVEVTNKSDEKTGKAIIEAKKLMKLKEDAAITLDFLKGLDALIISSMPTVGDVNGDGTVDIKDATEIQKIVARIGE
ncbi:MAG: GH25 family lysozyme [Eubacteriales bacterium]|nr:GH25 family lysozyme [Eubacteriales bacterium]